MEGYRDLLALLQGVAAVRRGNDELECNGGELRKRRAAALAYSVSAASTAAATEPATEEPEPPFSTTTTKA